MADFLRKAPYVIASEADVDRFLRANFRHGDTSRTRAKLLEWVRSGRIGRACELRTKNVRNATLQLFARVWGVGPETAQALYAAGFRTLASLHNADLDRRQRIGLRYFDEFELKIPRDEVL